MGAIQQSSPVARKLFNMAYESKRAAIRSGDLSGGRFGPMWDRLVFSKVRARLGGICRMVSSTLRGCGWRFLAAIVALAPSAIWRIREKVAF